jgi:hypothetical protein
MSIKEFDVDDLIYFASRCLNIDDPIEMKYHKDRFELVLESYCSSRQNDKEIVKKLQEEYASKESNKENS